MDGGMADQCRRILSEESVANRQLRASKRDGVRPLKAHRIDGEEETKDSEIHAPPHKKRRVAKPRRLHAAKEMNRVEWEERDQVVSDEDHTTNPKDDDPVLTVGANGSPVDASATHDGMSTTAMTTGTAVPMLRTLAEWRMVDEELKASRRDTELLAKHVMESQRRRHALLGLTASEWI
jgi:hypothetical protein